MTFSTPLKIIAAAFLLASCAEVDPARVPVTMMGTRGVSTVSEITARAGQTPETLSRQAGMDITQLLELNGLVAQQNLSPGQRLKLPVPSQVQVIEGDTIDTIAKAFGLDRNKIAQQNNLRSPYLLTRGQMLRLPQDSAAAPVLTASTSDVPSPTFEELPPVTSGPIPTNKIAVVEEDLAPPPGASVATAPPPAVPSLPSPTAPISPPVAPPAQTKTAMTAPAKPVQTLGTGIPSFSWPVNGSVLSRFGAKADGVKNDGLDIGAPQGTPVKAAAPGEVVYTGDKVAGFGNLILLRHSGGFATAYAHVQKPLVKRGDRVSAGQAIAQVGKTGNVTRPMLHFEIRKGTSPVNPNTYLP